MIDKEEFFLGAAILMAVLVGGAIGYTAKHIECEADGITTGMEVSEKIFIKENMRAFCRHEGYESGWFGCAGEGYGVTCYRVRDGWTKYTCYKMTEVYDYLSTVVT